MKITPDEILCIIPARAGSKGVKNKNIKKLKSKPLVDYTLDIATRVFPVENIYISTDSKEIAERGNKYNLPIRELRPKPLATDNALTIDTVLHTLDQLEKGFKAICLLQPTSPFRSSKDVLKCIDILNSNSSTSVVSVCKIDEPHPHKMKKISDNRLVPYIKDSDSSMPRQSLEEIYSLNGCIYLTKIETIFDDRNFFGKISLPYEMNELQSVNINSNFDWMIAEKILEEDLLIL